MLDHESPLQEGVRKQEQCGLEFVGEHEGPAASLWHGVFSKELSRFPKVERAYFCDLRYMGIEEVVAICIVSVNGEDSEVIHGLATLIRQKLDPAFHMDILFLSPLLESQLRAVCDPFYDSSSEPTSVMSKIPPV